MTPATSLPDALQGQRENCTRRVGRMAYYAKGKGAPVLLVHSINAAASAYEVRPIWDAAPDNWRVYAPDLPGFGHSDRSDRHYSRDTYVDAILDMLDEIEQHHGATPVDVLALSLSCEFVARAALRAPHLIRRLAFVTPTGFQKGSEKLTDPAEGTREIAGLHRTVSLPLLSDALWAGLVSRASIRFFLQKTFGTKDIDESLLAYDYLTAHQPGAKHAPLAFVSGRLFSSDIRRVYEALDCPVYLAHATRGDFADFREAGWVDSRLNWKRQSFDAGALVHFEQPGPFMAQLVDFFAKEPASAPGENGAADQRVE